MNILTFDIEEWVLEKEHFGNRKEKYAEFDKTLNHILELLDANKQSATFFCLGKLAIDFPHVIKKIASYGHEIGSHSHAHKWITKMSPDEFKEDTASAINALEDITGKKVESFRAPAFSIGESNQWAIEILAECGIKNDASIFPGVRDFGGFPTFNEQRPCKIEYKGCIINEFPIPLYRIPLIGKDLAYSGGGYFRLLPISFIKNRINTSDYNICYFHIEDLLTDKCKLMTKEEFEDYFKERGTLKNRFLRYIKSNIGRRNSNENFDKLIDTVKFQSISAVVDRISLEKIIKI